MERGTISPERAAPPGSARLDPRRRRLISRGAPLAGIAAVAFAAGVVSATSPARHERETAQRYAAAWAKRDYTAMYEQLDDASQRSISYARFAAANEAAATMATLVSARSGRAGHRRGNLIGVPVVVHTRVFGVVRAVLEVSLHGHGSGARVSWGPQLVFPGLRPGERLRRHVLIPARAALLARDGTPLAAGPTRTSPIPDVAAQIAGSLAAPDPATAAAREAYGFPATVPGGTSGLERVFDAQLRGQPGGTLIAGNRVLASTQPQAATAVHTTIDPRLERAATAALAGRYGGIAALDPHTGEVLALAGVAFSALQPPGSTFKIITTVAALEAGVVKPSTTFPIATGAFAEGRRVANANGEACGGTLVNAFAVSCNSVFVPLGVKAGADQLVATAERFGFNEAPTFAGAQESSIPTAEGIAGEVGVSAIGQGKVLATALEMTTVGATIAMRGRRPLPTLLLHARPRFVRVTSRRVATMVLQMMLAVVRYGTGTSASIPGVLVAGKTGTAELRNTTGDPNDPNAGSPNDPRNTDAWFVGFAPALRPRIVVGALFPSQGAGGQTAAPAVREVLAAALQH